MMVEQVRAIIDVLERGRGPAPVGDPALAAMISVGAAIGARRGELCGLRWSDIDWEAQTLTIERQWVPGAGGVRLTGTKTGKARTIPIPQVIETLRYWRALVEEQYRVVDEDGWLFSRDGGATPMRPQSVTAKFGEVAKSLGINAHFHDLRHFVVTRAVSGGWDITEASRYFGHSPAVMLGTYAHGNPERAKQLAKTLGVEKTP